MATPVVPPFDPVTAALGVAQLGFGAYQTKQANKLRKEQKQATLNAEKERQNALRLSASELADENALRGFGQNALTGALSAEDQAALDRERTLTDMKLGQAEGNESREMAEYSARRGIGGSPAAMAAQGDVARKNLERRQALAFEREGAALGERERRKAQGLGVLTGGLQRAAGQRAAMSSATPGLLTAGLAGEEAAASEQAAGSALAGGGEKLFDLWKNRNQKKPVDLTMGVDKRGR